jgi:predicted  nucleic acid-binding Zn-ribbon protein
MSESTMGALRMAQTLDERIRELRAAMASFDERLEEVEAPAAALEKELAQAEERVEQMRADVRRLERSSDDKRARGEKLDQRLNRVSNLREEAAVRAEVDMIRRAIETDEQEALQLLDQIRRLELSIDELGERTRAARGAVGPRQAQLLSERESYSSRLVTFEARRGALLSGVGSRERRIYDSFHQSGRKVVVAALHEDGACGLCFGVIPVQIQNQVRRGEGLVQCEACGVILTAEPDPILDEELLRPISLEDEADTADSASEEVRVPEDVEG